MAAKLPMRKNVGATEVRNNMGKLLNRVFRGEEQLVIEKLGIPVAAIISMKDYEQYRRLLAVHLHNELGRKIGAEAEKQRLTEEQLLGDMKETRREVFEETYGNLTP